MLRFKKYKFFLFFLFYTLVAFSQTPPEVYVSGNQLFCGEAPMPIVTEVSINSDSELENVYIQISQGYTQGQDQLVLIGNHPGISSSWAPNEGVMTLSGNASGDDYESAVASVVFQTTQTNFTEDKVFSINLGNANFLPSTGHYYFYISDVGISWGEAKNEAEDLTYFGLQGYLATITTEEEAQLAGQQSPGTGWIGGSDRISEGVWIWETGPEAGEIFWNGAVDGSAPDGVFTFWNTGEPNNCCGGENYAHITSPNVGMEGSWNDLPVTGSLDPASDYHPQGYIVEFGGLPNEPELNVSGSTTIVTPKLDILTESICESGNAVIAVSTNTDEVIWFETPSSTEVLGTGLMFESYIEDTTTFWVTASFNGCNGGPRIPVTVTVYDLPLANDLTIAQCDDETIDGIAVFNLSNNFYDLMLGNNPEEIGFLQVTLYQDDALQLPISSNQYYNVSNPQIVYAEVFNTQTGCAAISEIELQVNTSLPVELSLEVCDDFEVDGFAFFNLLLANDQILDNAPIGSIVAYYETYNDALLENNRLTNYYPNIEAYNQTIYARVDTELGCFSINEVDLYVKDIPSLNQFEEVYYCLNSFPETISLNGGVLEGIPNNFYYQWSTGETTINIDVNQIGTYTVLVTEPFACTNQRIVEVLPSNVATIEGVEVSDLVENNTIAISVSGEGEYVYALDNANGPYQESNTIENITSGIHTVYVMDIKNNCGVTAEEISVLGYPKFFTPNGDATNERWEIKGFFSRFPVTAIVEIYDRYGKLLTILNEDSPSWDGTLNGNQLPSNDYWFIANFEDGRTIKGHFALKR